MINQSMFTSKSAEWATPQDFFDKLNQEFHFNLDPACTELNAKCDKYYTREQNGLQQPWGVIECSATRPMAASSVSG